MKVRIIHWNLSSEDTLAFGTLILVLNTEVSSIQRSFNTLQYYTGTQNGVLITEISTFQRFVIERFHCIWTCVQYVCMYVCLYYTKLEAVDRAPALH